MPTPKGAALHCYISSLQRHIGAENLRDLYSFFHKKGAKPKAAPSFPNKMLPRFYWKVILNLHRTVDQKFSRNAS